MQFTSLAYLLFLPTVFLLYWGLPSRWRCAVVVVASAVFYVWWDVRFLALMVATCGAVWALALCMEGRRGAARRRLAGAAVGVSLSVLCGFKYFDFFMASASAALESLGWRANLPLLGVALPVGVSFYTFQTIGYVVDVYRGEVLAERSALRFFAFVGFFPQLVAGPIERSANLLPQFALPRRFDRAEATEGMRRILWGLLKKMVLADNCGAVADHVFAHYEAASSGELWVGALCFAFQIYGDFSAYSDMAIGSARLFGIRLMENFDRPYFSCSVPEFWRRWHISLMTWLRDYVYIPLGGSRRGAGRKWFNTLAVFLLSGLWHGAGWTFVAWGAYHAVLFLPYALFPALGAVRRGLGDLCRRALVFFLVLLGWVVFRAESLDVALVYLQRMFSFTAGGIGYSRLPLLYIVLFVTVEALWGAAPLKLKPTGWLRYGAVRMAVYLVLFLTALLLGGRPAEFIYFQF